MAVKALREYLGVGREEFAAMYRIPLLTLTAWEEEKEEVPEYVLYLLEKAVTADRQKKCSEEAVPLLYKHIGHPLSQMKWDKEYGYLIEQKGKDGYSYWWYKDGITSAAICMEDQRIIDDAKKLEELFQSACADMDLVSLFDVL